jgi:hypothetical protein
MKVGRVVSIKCWLLEKWTSGETAANLNVEGKVPRLEERLARVEMSTGKTELHDLMREVGMVSMVVR